MNLEISDHRCIFDGGSPFGCRFKSGAGTAHDCNFDLIPEELLCVPVLEDLVLVSLSNIALKPR